MLDTSRTSIGRRVHDILVPETLVQDVEHKLIVFFSQVLCQEYYQNSTLFSQFLLSYIALTISFFTFLFL